MPCLHCGKLIEMKWKQVAWETGKSETAVYICQVCGGRITDQDKAQMVQAGCWQEVEQTAHRPDMRLWINPFYSPLVRFSDAAKEFLGSRDNPERMKNFITFWLAEPWE